MDIYNNIGTISFEIDFKLKNNNKQALTANLLRILLKYML